MAFEIERKFLVNSTDYRDMASSHSRIRQGYICRESGRTVRIRIRDGRGFLTIKGPSPNGISRYEFEKEISLDEAEHLFELCQPGVIDKTRYLVPMNDGPSSSARSLATVATTTPISPPIPTLPGADFPQSHAEEGGKRYSHGIGGKVDPVATPAPTGAILLKQFDAAAHHDGQEPCPEEEPNAVALPLVLQQILNPQCAEGASIHRYVHPLVDERHLVELRLRGSEKRQIPY